MVGETEGEAEGGGVGEKLGEAVGMLVGGSDGSMDGAMLGKLVGPSDGARLGKGVGMSVFMATITIPACKLAVVMLPPAVVALPLTVVSCCRVVGICRPSSKLSSDSISLLPVAWSNIWSAVVNTWPCLNSVLSDALSA